MVRQLLFVILLVTLLGSCVSNQAGNANTPELSLNWAGVYSGVTPAADGPGIEVQLALNANKTFILQYHYVDKGDNIFIQEGNFTWNKAGDSIILDIENTPPYYKVEENKLIQLDMQGKRITGDLAALYVLKKTL
jgi:uncharacterized lipoprotein NlpE involved in copper resistance